MIGQAPGLRPSCYQICSLVPVIFSGRKNYIAGGSVGKPYEATIISCKVVGPRHGCEKKERKKDTQDDRFLV